MWGVRCWSRRERDLGWGRREFHYSMWDPNGGEGEGSRGAGVEILGDIRVDTRGIGYKRMTRPSDRLSVGY